jgi:hypothetical protein
LYTASTSTAHKSAAHANVRSSFENDRRRKRLEETHLSLLDASRAAQSQQCDLRSERERPASASSAMLQRIGGTGGTQSKPMWRDPWFRKVNETKAFPCELSLALALPLPMV